MTRGGLLVLCLSVSAIAATGFSMVTDAAPRIAFNPSPSASQGFYLIRRTDALAVGDLVLLRVPEAFESIVVDRRYLGPNVPLLKRIVAMSGDHVCHRGGAVFINGRYVASTLRNDSAGRPMPIWRSCRTLDDHEIFALMEGVETSLDSRYFGPLDRKLVLGTAELLWLWQR
jgi:conjugative transfer signal peptidase TraF